MRTEIYTHIRQRLNSIETIKWTDLDTRQVNEPKENYPIPFPAVLVDFGNFDYSERANGAQEVVARVSVNVWQHRHFDEFSDGDGGIEKITSLFGLVDTIGIAIHNSYIPKISISPFIRKAENTIAQFGNIFGYAINF